MLTLDRLVTSYPAFQLGPIDLQVDREVLAVLGPSGCGKTTLLASIAGTVAPASGRILFDGKSVDGVPVEARRAALVFQDSAAFPHMTARENIAYAAADPAGVPRIARLLEITNVLDQKARTLSGGERRRVEVARALAAAPRVLLLDEPTAGLDAPIKRRLRDQLREVLAALDIPVLYVTHDQREAAAVADRLAVMKAGVLHQVDVPTAVFDRPATPFVAAFTGNANVFPARVVRRTPRPALDWNGLAVQVPDYGFEPGTDVWLCVRPEQVNVVADGRADTANVFDAGIDRCVYEGGEYVLTLSVGADSRSSSLEVRMLPPSFRQLDLGGCDRVGVHFAEEALHLIARAASGEETGLFSASRKR